VLGDIEQSALQVGDAVGGIERQALEIDLGLLQIAALGA
jgi:hypothetical protein